MKCEECPYWCKDYGGFCALGYCPYADEEQFYD